MSDAAHHADVHRRQEGDRRGTCGAATTARAAGSVTASAAPVRPTVAFGNVSVQSGASGRSKVTSRVAHCRDERELRDEGIGRCDRDDTTARAFDHAVDDRRGSIAATDFVHDAHVLAQPRAQIGGPSRSERFRGRYRKVSGRGPVERAPPHPPAPPREPHATTSEGGGHTVAPRRRPRADHKSNPARRTPRVRLAATGNGASARSDANPSPGLPRLGLRRRLGRDRRGPERSRRTKVGTQPHEQIGERDLDRARFGARAAQRRSERKVASLLAATQQRGQHLAHRPRVDAVVRVPADVAVHGADVQARAAPDAREHVFVRGAEQRASVVVEEHDVQLRRSVDLARYRRGPVIICT